jgi:hypothetical protein
VDQCRTGLKLMHIFAVAIAGIGSSPDYKITCTCTHRILFVEDQLDSFLNYLLVLKNLAVLPAVLTWQNQFLTSITIFEVTR